ncbi:tetratricopeptide repeat protein [Oceanicaulis sp. MMSF_3324]|uniref:tetratricopeptide repeat protein n=1 Tax=Oceanicaulis sp. MMSF_3324 TaxID=3046702 RepID=UPI00273FF2ED|nr:tetratricopeptide repeat protein [Oceanicaulis sp. MMSF_3324]
MRRLVSTLGLILVLGGVAWGQEDAPTVPTAEEVEGGQTPRSELPALPEGLAEDFARDASGDAVEGRSLTNSAMASASAAYMVGDFQGALIHAQRAAAGGEARGATLAGHIRLHGLSGDANDGDAVRWFRRAAELGEPDALIVLSRLASEGRGGLEVWQSREFLAQAAEAGDARAAHEYGLYLMERGDPGAASEALNWLQLAAESGRFEAYGDYAYALADWDHGPHDLSSARSWYERAGEAGDPSSALIAGLMYMDGEGGEADEAEGARLIRMAAEYGLPAAMGQHALLLFQGVADREPNPTEAVDWARQGADANDPDSQFLLAYALATGDGAPQNLKRAYYWVLRAGAPRGGRTPEDFDRDRLEASLENALPAPVLERVRVEAAVESRPF